jgi:ligand-binding SRPBCC domain-containing protein
MRIRGVPVRGRTRIEELDPPRRFTEVRLKGPYAHWRHTHLLEPAAQGTLMRDIVRYRLPLGAVGSLVAGRLARRGLARLFAYRRRELAARFGGGTGEPRSVTPVAFPSGLR